MVWSCIREACARGSLRCGPARCSFTPPAHSKRRHRCGVSLHAPRLRSLMVFQDEGGTRLCQRSSTDEATVSVCPTLSFFHWSYPMALLAGFIDHSSPRDGQSLPLSSQVLLRMSLVLLALRATPPLLWHLVCNQSASTLAAGGLPHSALIVVSTPWAMGNANASPSAPYTLLLCLSWDARTSSLLFAVLSLWPDLSLPLRFSRVPEAGKATTAADKLGFVRLPVGD